MALHPEQQRFIDFAMKDFDFLVSDFGFAATHGEMIAFAKEALPLKITLSWYKGEVDCDFEVLLENSVFRPYISRRFSLGEIVNHIDPNAISAALKESPLPRWALSAEDAHCFLQYNAKLVRKFCRPILKDDFTVLEALTWDRRRIYGQTDVERYGRSGQKNIEH
jgi:hypothetical protein